MANVSHVYPEGDVTMDTDLLTDNRAYPKIVSSEIDSKVEVPVENGFPKFYLAALIVCMGQLSMGAALGYSSPALLSIAKNNSGFENLTDEQTSWIGSISSIGAMIGGLAGGPFIDQFGRKTLLVGSLFPFTAGWLTIALSGRFSIMIIGRLLTGFCVGLMSLVVPVYLSEVSPAKIRGFFGSCLQLSCFVGILVAFLLGELAEWSELAYICILFPVICSVPMIFFPESPRWLIQVGRKEEAIKAVSFLHGTKVDPVIECNQMEENSKQNQNTGSVLSEFKRKEVLHPVILVLILMTFQQWVGFSAVLFFAGDIFKMSGYKTITANVSAIILAASQCGGTIFSSFIIDRAGRKILLISSGIIMTLALAGLSTMFLLEESRDSEFISSYGWVTVTSLSIYVGAFAMGFGPIAWLMMSEILPVKVRGPASALGTAVNWFSSFLSSKLFNMMKESMHPYGVFFLFMAVCIIASIFVWFFLPETKGKSLEEIERIYSKDRNLNVQSGDAGEYGADEEEN